MGHPVKVLSNQNTTFCTNQYFELNRNTGHIYIRSDIPEDEMRQPLTLVVRATQFDNADR